MYKSPYTFWAMWPSLSYLNRLFVLISVGVSIYSILSASIIWKLIRAGKNLDEETTRGDSDITAIQTRCSNLRQLLGATFFLFGFLFFLGLPNATITLGDSHGLSTFVILNNFVFHFVFDEPPPLHSVIVSDDEAESGPLNAALMAAADPSHKYITTVLSSKRAADRALETAA